MISNEFKQWLKKVVEHINDYHEYLFNRVIHDYEYVSGEDCPNDPTDIILWLRKDEPEEMFSDGYDADDYAADIIDYWKQYGP